MSTRKIAIGMLAASLVLVSGCAASLEAEQRRAEMEADIDLILAQPLPEEFGEAERCLSDSQIRSYRALGERHLLFEGSRDRYWVNTLRSNCSDLKWGETLIVRRFSGSRICELDRFSATDWFGFPWYRRAPATWGSGVQCTLGEFQPVTLDQVREIETVLDRD